MEKNSVQDIINSLNIDLKDIPVDYCWSGYANDTKDFEEANFYRITSGRHKFLVCSSENAIALCEYVSNKILKQQCVWDTENIYSPGCDIWFMYAWEMILSSLDELPQWIQDIIEFLITLEIILRCNIDEQENFVLVDPEYYLNNEFPVELTKKIEHICQKAVIEFWNECLDEVDGNADNVVKSANPENIEDNDGIESDKAATLNSEILGK
jgi:hypothetical protein